MTKDETDFTKFFFFSTGRNWIVRLMNLNDKSVKITRKTYIMREGQKVPTTIFFLFTWVHLYKGGSVYIKYEPLSFMPCNMESVARLVALRH